MTTASAEGEKRVVATRIFPRSIPSSFGVEVEKHLTKMVNDEVTRLVAVKAAANGDRAP